MIKVRRLSEEPGEPEREEGTLGVDYVDIILKRNDLKAFSSRILRIEPGGHTSFHEHNREHLAIVLHGRCRVETKNSTSEIKEAMTASIPSKTWHRFLNPGNERLALLILNLFVEEELASPEKIESQTSLVEGAKTEGP